MKSGVILAFALGTRSQELFEMVTETYNIYREGKLVHENLTQDEYFDAMQDLAEEFYNTGSPLSDELETKIIRSEN